MVYRQLDAVRAVPRAQDVEVPFKLPLLHLGEAAGELPVVVTSTTLGKEFRHLIEERLLKLWQRRVRIPGLRARRRGVSQKHEALSPEFPVGHGANLELNASTQHLLLPLRAFEFRRKLCPQEKDVLVNVLWSYEAVALGRLVAKNDSAVNLTRAGTRTTGTGRRCVASVLHQLHATCSGFAFFVERQLEANVEVVDLIRRRLLNGLGEGASQEEDVV
mmetsp:Transcript_12103/g.26874  ORF Transcript_12103/g.26874 Transcript_12103/m.26874 type:complete len:218 (-) Transcript_12103:2336-2989(-)